MSLKKMLVILLALVLALACAACGEEAVPEVEAAAEEATEPEVGGEGSVNPFVDCATAEEAAAILGFDFSVPEHISGSGQCVLRASESLQMFEAVYPVGDGELRLRKAVGGDDISGVYESFPTEESLRIGSRQVTIKGNDSGDVLSCWTADGYSYSVYASGGMDREDMVDLIASLN